MALADPPCGRLAGYLHRLNHLKAARGGRMYGFQFRLSRRAGSWQGRLLPAIWASGAGAAASARPVASRRMAGSWMATSSPGPLLRQPMAGDRRDAAEALSHALSNWRQHTVRHWQWR